MDIDLRKAASLAQSGRFDEAAAAYRALLGRAPHHPEATHFLGVCLVRGGRRDEGLHALARAVELAPRNAQFRQNYGLLLAEAGDLASAEQQFRAILEAAPHSAPAAHDVGWCRLQQGDFAGAADWFRRSLAAAPENAVAHNSLGSALRALGELEQAAASYRRAASLAPRHPDPPPNLALTLRDLGAAREALAAARACVRCAPERAAAWQLFADLLAPLRFSGWDAALAADVERLLADTAVQVQDAAEAILSLVRAAPRGRLFLLLIEHVLVADEALERELAALRREALLAPRSLELACALAQQCFLNEYLWPEGPEETQAVDALLAVARTPLEIATLAMYRPIAGFSRPAGGGAAFERLWRRLVEEPRAEAALAQTIPALTAIGEGVSRQVQAQYEAHPYPRWHRAPALPPHPLPRMLRELFPHAHDLRVPAAAEILIAGCGTGRHAAITAQLQPQARILALDLSRASLAHALRRSRELGLANLRFAQADIAALGALPERFDVVEASGVLHHMRDPLEGWRVLAGLLRPGGVMKLGLYSELGRAAIAQARSLVAGLEVREARRRLLELPAGHPARRVAGLRDFYSASGTRDLVLHVEEHRFTLPRLAEALRELGLQFLGFELSHAVLARYRAHHPHDAAATSLDGWAQFEAAEPDTFSAMYQFWVRR